VAGKRDVPGACTASDEKKAKNGRGVSSSGSSAEAKKNQGKTLQKTMGGGKKLPNPGQRGEVGL